MILNDATDSIKAIGDFCNGIGTGFYYITHPDKLAVILWPKIDDASFYICIIVCLGAVVAHLAGWEKGKKVAIASPLIYTLIRMINVSGVV